MDILKEAGNFAHYINTKVKRGFRASMLADRSIRVEFSDSENSFDVVFIADSAYNVFVPDYCPVGMKQIPRHFNHRQHLGYLFLQVSEHNVKMAKRLNNA